MGTDTLTTLRRHLVPRRREVVATMANQLDADPARSCPDLALVNHAAALQAALAAIDVQLSEEDG